jgi:hypothetical protein
MCISLRRAFPVLNHGAPGQRMQTRHKLTALTRQRSTYATIHGRPHLRRHRVAFMHQLRMDINAWAANDDCKSKQGMQKELSSRQSPGCDPNHETEAPEQKGQEVAHHPKSSRRRAASIVDDGSMRNCRGAGESQEARACVDRGTTKCVGGATVDSPAGGERFWMDFVAHHRKRVDVKPGSPPLTRVVRPYPSFRHHTPQPPPTRFGASSCNRGSAGPALAPACAARPLDTLTIEEHGMVPA